VVSLNVGFASTYAFAPAAFGLDQGVCPQAGVIAAAAAPYLFSAAALIQADGCCAFLAVVGNRPHPQPFTCRIDTRAMHADTPIAATE